MTIVTIYALFAGDIQAAAFNKDSDSVFTVLLILCFIFFAVEIFLNTIVADDFKYSFFFWLDIIATISLCIDMNWFTDMLQI